MLKRDLAIISVLWFLMTLAFSAQAYAGENLSKEIELGRKVAVQVEERWERVSDPVLTARLNMLLQRLTPMLQRDLPYEIRLIREDSPNAFSLPGGIIFLTTGMLDFTHSDSEIAAILAHELIHADRKHVMIQIARNQKISLVTLAIIVASKGETVPAVLANVAQVTISNSYSRDLEKQADIEGTNILVAADFPPSAMVTVMEGLSEEELKHPYVDPGIYRDHPEISERISYLIRHIRDRGWPLERKKPLNILRCHFVSDQSNALVFIDETEIIRGPADGQTIKALKEIASKLDQELQLEMAPYDIQVIQDPDSGTALQVNNSIVLAEQLTYENDLPDPDTVRERIIQALLEAQSIHPTVDFMKR